MSQVFYRKWRPRTLAEVVGQEPITRTLLNALASGKVAHAYLFCGPRGTGKTSTGRILAKAVNCLNNGQGEPCNSCTLCQAVAEGRALDLVEIDAASNRGIDEIRDLREKIGFAPNISKYKVYIIDEVHMLTEPAFNALLKTLEEPPPHAIFILATTEAHKVPLTILSRCQRFDFRRLSLPAVVSKLQHICEHEGISIEPQALALAAKGAGGSLRDAENILEQLALCYGSDVTLEQVQAELGLSADRRVRELAEHILGKNIAAGLMTINSVSADGLDLRQFNRSLIEYLRELLLVKAGAEGSADIASELVAEMKQLDAGILLEDISKAIKLFSQVDFRIDSQSTLPLELALVDCSLSATETSKKTAPVEKARGAAPSSVTPRPPVAKVASQKVAEPPVRPPAEVSQSPVADTPVEPDNTPLQGSDEVSEEVAKAATPVISHPVIPQAEHTVEDIQRHWNDFVNACRGMGSSGNLDALLRKACEVVSLEDDTLVLGFYWDFQRSKIEDPKYRHLVEHKLQEVFGIPYNVRCILTPKSKEERPQAGARNHLVEAALEMGARIIDEERKDV